MSRLSGKNNIWRHHHNKLMPFFCIPKKVPWFYFWSRVLLIRLFRNILVSDTMVNVPPEQSSYRLKYCLSILPGKFFNLRSGFCIPWIFKKMHLKRVFLRLWFAISKNPATLCWLIITGDRSFFGFLLKISSETALKQLF